VTITPAGYVVIAVAALAIVLAIAWFVGERRIKRTIASAPHRAIAALSDGAVARVAGKVVLASAETIRAPLSGRACVFYEIRVQEWMQQTHGYWRETVHELRGVPFTLEDDSGRVQIDPAGARAELETDKSTRSGPMDDATPVEEAFLERHHLSSKGFFANKQIRYRECAVEVGDTIAVTGTAAREGDALCIAGTQSLPLLIEDEPIRA